MKTEGCQSLKITLQLFLKKYGSVGDENNRNEIIQLNCYNTGTIKNRLNLKKMKQVGGSVCYKDENKLALMTFSSDAMTNIIYIM